MYEKVLKNAFLKIKRCKELWNLADVGGWDFFHFKSMLILVSVISKLKNIEILVRQHWRIIRSIEVSMVGLPRSDSTISIHIKTLYTISADNDSTTSVCRTRESDIKWGSVGTTLAMSFADITLVIMSFIFIYCIQLDFIQLYPMHLPLLAI